MRKSIAICDRCGFEEETNGVFQQSVRTVETNYHSTTSTVGSEFSDRQDMCEDCRVAVVDQLKALFKKKGQP